MKLVLHIGTDKTGSTAIQRALWANREWFLTRGVYIPETGLGVDNGHAVLLQALDNASLSTLAQELEQAGQGDYTAALISWEGLSRFNDKQLKTLMGALANPAAELLVYLRDQAEVIQSAHLQWVQMNPSAMSVKSLSVPRSLAQRVRQYLFLRHPQRNYHKLLRRWQAANPNVTFNLRRYASEHLLGTDVITDFLAQFGLTKDDGFTAPTEPTNPSIDVETALLLERWRTAALADEDIATRLDLAVAIAEQDGTGNRYFLDKDAVDAIRRHFVASNRKAAAIAGLGHEFEIATQSRCWRTEPFSSAENRATTRDQKVDEENAIPTLHHDAAGESLGDKLLLHSGWSGVEDWGVWSESAQSILQFRIPKQPNVATTDQLELSVFGKYYADNRETEIKANDLELGSHDLSSIDRKLRIPLSELGPLQRLTLELTHQSPTSPADLEGSEDARELAFALCSLSYRIVPRNAE